MKQERATTPPRCSPAEKSEPASAQGCSSNFRLTESTQGSEEWQDDDTGMKPAKSEMWRILPGLTHKAYKISMARIKKWNQEPMY